MIDVITNIIAIIAASMAAIFLLVSGLYLFDTYIWPPFRAWVNARIDTVDAQYIEWEEKNDESTHYPRR